MKRLFLILVLIFPLTLGAQEYEKKGDRAYAAGDYSEAKIQFEAALALLQANKVNENSQEYLMLQRKLTRAVTCIPLKNQADNLFAVAAVSEKEDDYAKAKAAYQKLLSHNSSDSMAKSRILECDSAITSISTRKADDALWAQISPQSGKSSYLAYLAEFPNGRHATQARGQIARLEDEELWLEAKEADSIEAYNKYIAQTKTQDYLSQAQYSICLIKDNDSWESIKDGQNEAGLKAYVSDTSNVCKQHLSQANAYLSIIKTKRYASSASADAKQIVKDLSFAQKSVILDAEAKRILEENRAQVDYEAFASNPTIEAGEQYLSRYPEGVGIYRESVSDRLARMYADNFNDETSGVDYNKALSYAITENTRQFVEDRYRTLQKAKKAKRRRYNWSDRWQLGLGADMELVGNFVWGPRAELKIGSSYDFFNFSVGAKFYMWNSGKVDSDYLEQDEYKAKVGAYQLPLYATLKFNLAELDNSFLYLAAEAAYNFNFGGQFKAPDLSLYSIYYGDASSSPPGLWQGEVVDDPNFIIKNNITAGLRLGLAWEIVDFGIYAKYDVTPMFDSEYAESTTYCEYSYIEKSMTNNFRIGFDLIIYIVM